MARTFYERIPGPLSRHLIEPLARLSRGGTRRGPRHLIRRFLAGAAKDPRGEQLRWQTFLPEAWLDRVYTPEMWRRARELDPWEAVVERAEATRGDALDRELAIEQGLYLPDDILTKLDRASMAVSLEARVPFLDHELVEFTARLPSALKMRWGRGKLLLRRAMKGRLPAEVLHRRKRGFGVPVDRWLRRDLRDRIMGALNGDALRECPWIEPVGATAMLEAHRRGDGELSHPLWCLYTLAVWLEELGEVGRCVVATGTPPGGTGDELSTAG
jgi:asparagine synthase (glutamine-hydrolysing)